MRCVRSMSNAAAPCSERGGADSKGVRPPLTLAPSTLPFSSRWFRIRTRSTDDVHAHQQGKVTGYPAAGHPGDRTAQFVAKVCYASPTTLIRTQHHIHIRQPTLPRKSYFGLTAHPPPAARPQHTQPRTPQLRTYQLRTYITKSQGYTTSTEHRSLQQKTYQPTHTRAG